VIHELTLCAAIVANRKIRKRETFAYACEVYSRILGRAGSPAERRNLAAEYGRRDHDDGHPVDFAEVEDIVREAAAARNGWKRIWRRCAQTTSRRLARR
jgi:hypothetical protein